jgi:stage II sporulation protein D
MKPRIHFSFLVLLLGASFFSAAKDPRPQTPDPTPHAAHPTPQTPNPKPQNRSTLRIGLWTLWHDKQITLTRIPQTPDPRPQTPVPIRASNSELILPNRPPISSLTVSGPITLSAHDETLTLRHPLSISARNGQLVLAVTLPLETYVERVVSSECGPTDSPESLRALAIVVRSFALHQPHGHADYDLCDSTHCQLLHWSATPSPSAHAATLATAGETLWYHGHPAATFFHQDCGGRTAAPSELWPSPPQGREVTSPARNTPYTPHPTPDTLAHSVPWLVSRPDPYCTANGVRSWSADISLADLTTALSASGLVLPGWRTFTVARRGNPALGQSPRPITLLAGSTEISAEDFRLAVGRAFGWGHILSTWFEIVPQGDHFLFTGRGSGHGVGLCQHGAAAMAAQGRTSSEILAQYFPGAEALDESTARPWQSLAVPSAPHTLTLETLALEPQASAATSYLPVLAQALAEAQSRSGLQPTGSLTVRAYPSTTAFRDATLAPGWVAAFAEGNFIATQPLATLSSRHLLLPTLRHEFLHAILEAHSSPSAPLWLREGLVEVFTDPPAASAPTPTIPLAQLDALLAHPASEAQSAGAHRAAAVYAGRLVNRYGRAQVLAWLATSLPANLALR